MAGIAGSTPIEEITLESWDRMMDIDLKSMFFVTQAVFAIMKEQGYGKLVHMSSLAALRGGRSSDASYACAKAGILNLSKCFALRGAPYHITSNAVCPGNILTPMGKTLSWSKVDPKTYIPLGRYGTAEDIANAVLFYASDLSDYVTGDSMNVNGGLVYVKILHIFYKKQVDGNLAVGYYSFCTAPSCLPRAFPSRLCLDRRSGAMARSRGAGSHTSMKEGYHIVSHSPLRQAEGA